jgi:hypothetical protein
MTLTDYLINFVLIALVILQIQDRRITLRALIRPVILVALAALYYLKGVPTAGNDVVLYLILGGVGLVFGAACACTTRIWRAADGFAHSKAGVVAAFFWVVGIGSRLAFEEYSTHGGVRSIEHFSVAHDITSSNAWVAALVIMALVEVIARLGLIRLRAARLPEGASSLSSPASTNSVIA